MASHDSPSNAHVRVFVAVRDGCPSGAHTVTPDREEVPQPSPSNPQLDGRTPHQYQMDLRDLGDAQLRQVMENLCQEVSLRELNESPQGPTIGSLGKLNGKWGPQYG